MNIVRALAAAVLMASSGTAWSQAPRVGLAGTSIARPDVEGPVRLVIKFSDVVRMRLDAAGVLVSETGANAAPVRDLLRVDGVRLVPAIDLPVERINALENRARARSGRQQSDLNGMFIARGGDAALERVAAALSGLDLVEWVAFEEESPPPPCEDLAPTTPSYVSMQGYVGPDPGINMVAAWTLSAVRGDGVRIADCEYGFETGHEDLCDVELEPGQTPDLFIDHGTAVLGEMLSLEGDYGTTGMVPGADGILFPEHSVESGSRRVTAVGNAIATSAPGDVVVLEMQTTGPGGGYGPAELDLSVWTLVQVATDAGVIVVAAAGNGSQDLDSAPYEEYMSRGDSGAIIVGAGTPDTNHNRLSFSTYGSRVNVQAWGSSVTTLGYGDLATFGPLQKYTAGFSGTSSATPIVASAVVFLQSLSIEHCGTILQPAVIRDALIATGVPQGSGGHIGPLPDVFAGAAYLGLPCDDCLGDIDEDGLVGFGDLLQILSDWGACTGCPADLNDDDVVDFADILVLFSAWGPC